MIDIRPFGSLGHADHGWLDARHHFSFADYHDRQRMHWGALRVWNDDAIAAGAGFPAHPHRDMEIVTYVREGAITHRDNLGNHGRTGAGDVQVMSAGTGIAHSEFNEESETTRLFQIWIMPREGGKPPSWGTRPFPRGDRAGAFVTLASGYPEDGDALPIHADARVAASTLGAGASADYQPREGAWIYLVAASGEIEVNGQPAGTRDGVAIYDEPRLTIRATQAAEIILVETGPLPR